MIPIQCRLGRTALGWGVRDLARNAKVSPNTVARLERGEAMEEATIAKLRAALEKGGVEFIPENGGGPGVRLAKRKGKKR
jgi:transcriptional regulator with XRE-family HTH domain